MILNSFSFATLETARPKRRLGISELMTVEL